MSWTWDTTELTCDQTCWTYDGYNGCAVEPPVGGGYPLTYREPYIDDEERRRKEEDVLVDLIMVMMAERII